MSAYHMTDLRWSTKVPVNFVKMTDQILLKWPTKVKYLNSVVSLDKSPSTSSFTLTGCDNSPALLAPLTLLSLMVLLHATQVYQSLWKIQKFPCVKVINLSQSI